MEYQTQGHGSVSEDEILDVAENIPLVAPEKAAGALAIDLSDRFANPDGHILGYD